MFFFISLWSVHTCCYVKAFVWLRVCQADTGDDVTSDDNIGDDDAYGDEIESVLVVCVLSMMKQIVIQFELI